MSTLVSPQFNSDSRSIGANSDRPFETYATQLVATGWSVFPQTSGSERNPGTVAGEMIKWKLDHDLVRRLPSSKALKEWISYCPDHNVAAVMGPASGHTIALDIDVTDPALSSAIGAIAKSIFGKSPFRRVGRQPKQALIYRRSPSENIITARRTAVDGGHAIELLCDGAALTFYGRHHVTGMPFKWFGKQPAVHGPEIAPLITGDMLEEFWFEVDKVMPIDTEQRTSGGDLLNISLVENGAGLISDGREGMLVRICIAHIGAWRTDNRNEHPSDDVIKRITTEVMQTFSRKCVMDGRWTPDYLRNEAVSRVRRLIVTSRAARSITNRTSNKHVMDGPVDRVARDDEPFSYWTNRDLGGEPQPMNPPDLGPIITTMREKIREFLDEANAPAQDASNIRLSADARVRDTLPSIKIMKAEPGFGKTSSAVEMIASDPLTYKDIMDEDGVRKRFPFVMLVPTYRNAEELRERAAVFNLDPSASDEDFIEAAKAAGLLHEEYLPIHVENMRNEAARADIMSKNGGNEFIVKLYQGRLKAGCRIPEQMGAATAAGIAANSLCKKTKERGKDGARPADGAETEDFCVHYHGCPAIAQREVFNHAHLVIMPHAFLALPIPEEAKNVRGVIVDERAHDLFLHTSSIPANVFQIIRKDPLPTKSEYAAGRARGELDEAIKENVALTLRSYREDASYIALRALCENKCPAETMFSFDPAVGFGMEAVAYTKAAKRLCAASMHREANLKPNMSLTEIEKVVAAPTGEYAREEWRFWAILEDRLSALMRAHVKATNLYQQRIEEAGEGDEEDEQAGTVTIDSLMALLPAGDKPCGSREMRLQIRHNPEDKKRKRDRIRMSWRTQPNWLNRPLLLLDASAAPEIVAKIWGREVADIAVVDLSEAAQLYQRVKVVLLTGSTYSNSFLAGDAEASANGAFDKEPGNLDHLRKIISWLAVKHGNGRMVVGATMMVRKLVNTNWMAPGNTDWCHYGALRGIDAFKRHEAALSIGRIEVPVDVIDGIAAALTYDDPEPEAPFDKFGTGKDEENKPLRLESTPKVFALRNGGTETLNIPTYPDKNRWCQILQRQYREEEILQFLGRLRVFHRPKDELPVWYSLSCVLPEGVIIDEIAQSDRSRGHKNESVAFLANAIRQNHGVVDMDMSDCTPKIDSQERNNALKAFGFDFQNATLKSRLFDKAGSFNEEAQYMLGYVSREFVLPKQDKVDAELGELHDRRTEELRILNEIILGLDTNFDSMQPMTFKQGKASYEKKISRAKDDENGTVVNLTRVRKLAKINVSVSRSRSISEWLALSALETYWHKKRQAIGEDVADISSDLESAETVDFSSFGEMIDPLEDVGGALSTLL